MSESYCDIENKTLGELFNNFSHFIETCSTEVGVFGSIASLLSLAMEFASIMIGLVGIVFSFFVVRKLNKATEASDLEYYRNTLDPEHFKITDDSSPQEIKEYRKAKELRAEIEAYQSRKWIRVYEKKLHDFLVFLQKKFKEPEVKADSPAKKAMSSDAENLPDSQVIKPLPFWQRQKHLASMLLSEGSYKFCLILAFAYPFVFALINGLVTNEVSLAGLTLIQFESLSKKVLLGLGGMMMCLAMLLVKKTHENYYYTRGVVLFLLAILCFFFLVLAFSGAFVDPYISSFSGTPFSTGTMAFTLAFIGSIAVVFFGIKIMPAVIVLVGGLTVYFAGGIGLEISNGLLGGEDGKAYLGLLLVGVVIFFVVFNIAAGITFEAIKVVAIVLSIFTDTPSFFPVIFFFASIIIAVESASTYFIIISVFAYFKFRIIFFGKENKSLKNDFLFTAFSLAYLLLSSFVILKYGEKDRVELVLIPLLLGILPILNAPIDWLSLNFTRLLSHQMSRHHTHVGAIAGLMLLDALAAIGFMLLITMVMLSVLTAANATVVWFNSPPLLDLSNIMHAMIAPDTYNQYYWVHFMVLSTLIPTMVHFVLLFVSLVLYPLGHQQKAAYEQFYEKQHHNGFIVMKHQQKKRYYAVTAALFAFVVLGGLIMNFTWAGCGLWHFADGFLNVIDAGYQSPGLTCGA